MWRPLKRNAVIPIYIMAIKYLDFFKINNSILFSSTHNLDQFRIEYMNKLKNAFHGLRADEVRRINSTVSFKNYPMRLFTTRYNLLNGIREGEVKVIVDDKNLNITYKLIVGESILLIILAILLLMLRFTSDKFFIILIGGLLTLPISKLVLKFRFNRFLNKYLARTESEIFELSSEQKEWINNKDLCPACGYKIKETDSICPDCGIKIID